MSSYRLVSSFIRRIFTKRFVHGCFYQLVRCFFSIKDGFVLLESHHGKDFGGSPYYMVRDLVASNEILYKRLVVVAPSHRAEWLRHSLGSQEIKVVRPRSFSYVYFLAVCKWLVSDVTFPAYFSRRKGQLYLNTWHGTPLKTLGRHAEGDVLRHLVNIQRNFLHSTSLLMPNSHTESVIFDSYFLNELYDGSVIRSGYPRNDVFLQAGGDVGLEGALNVAFMPTWRGEITDRRGGSGSQISGLISLFDSLERVLPDGVIVWVRLHALVSGSIDMSAYRRIKDFPLDVEAYVHLAACDVLVTDYSSVFFDFAITGKPIIRYIPDESGYISDRGFCLDSKTLPFPCAKSVDELVSILLFFLDSGSHDGSSSRSEFLREYCPYDRGGSANFVNRVFFGGAKEGEVVGVSSRSRVAIYFDPIVCDPSEFFVLFDNMTLTGLEFVLIVDVSSVTPGWKKCLKSLPQGFSYVAVDFDFYSTPQEMVLMAVSLCSGTGWTSGTSVWRRFAQREFERLFGCAKFDFLISFCRGSIKSSILEFGSDWKNSLLLDYGCYSFDAGRVSTEIRRWKEVCS